ncbi:MAG: tRNA 5-methoxyuridine(34)/uridine 5-oxyacetic acid(34) synthase CmoB [Pseudomonadales bacterium]|nr:tRNA 5-methoxyuridine(34)/uridine 5-oxyacetic acid(34) synthase CmoB [Pseudomonadales bacterium]
MNSLKGIARRLAADGLDGWLDGVPEAAAAALAPGRHGDLPRWRSALAALPPLEASSRDLAAPAVRIGSAGDADDETRERLRVALQALMPWRKGPFELFGVTIDAEWRSDLKWSRVLAAEVPLADARILDVGCGNGYYALRMRGAGARRVIGVDPTLVHLMQFEALQHYLHDDSVDLLPLPFEALPEGSGAFDLVFSMGVLYHRRSPLDHLAALATHLRRGGSLVLETLVVEGPDDRVLCPAGRYARMRNVWFLPTPGLLRRWLERLGLVKVRVLDLSPTRVAEQRTTAWMPFESLAEALDPGDPSRTVEGEPAPLRALLVAERP